MTASPRRRLVATVGALALLSGLAVGPRAEAETATTAGGAESPLPAWRQVSSGGNHTCGIRTSGRLYCWGQDPEGQLGDGGAAAGQITPVEVAGGATNWTSVDAGFNHTCGLRSTGRLYCWGSGIGGQVGDGAAVPRHVPRPVAGPVTAWRSVSTGGLHTCAIATTGRLYCWGVDNDGQLGDGGTDTQRNRPRQAFGGGTNWTSVSAGGDHTCARRSTGRLYCWGGDDGGQIGDGGGHVDRRAPREVAGGVTTWTSVSTGTNFTCARRSTGRLWCWGGDHNGQLGDGGVGVAHAAPVLVAGGFTDWVNVTTGASFACGRRGNGELWCWGDDTFGELGNGLPLAKSFEPVLVSGGFTDWAAGSAGIGQLCARRTTGQLYCWGYDVQGQLGDGGTNTDQPEPVEIP